MKIKKTFHLYNGRYFFINKKLLNYFDIKVIALSLSLINIWFISNFIFYIFIFVILFYFWIKKINLKKALFSYFFTIIFFFIYLLFWNTKNLNLTYFLDQLFGFSLRNILINFIDKNYSGNLKYFLNLILFNNKNNDSKYLYKLFVEISSVHLIVISGAHFSLFLFIFRKIFFFNRTIEIIFTLLLSFFICYFNNFSLSIFRCFIYYLLDLLFKNKCKNKLDLSLIIILLIIPLGLTNYGMQMSFICLLVINFFSKTKLSSKFLKSLLISFFINLFLLPYNSIFNGSISILSLFYSSIMSPIVMFFYVLYSFLFLFKDICLLTESLFNLFMLFLFFLKNINIELILIKLDKFIWFIYMLSLYLFLFAYRRYKIYKLKN